MALRRIASAGFVVEVRDRRGEAREQQIVSAYTSGANAARIARAQGRTLDALEVEDRIERLRSRYLRAERRIRERNGYRVMYNT